MSKISTIEITELAPVLNKVKEKSSGCQTLEEAAQRVTDGLYDEFNDSIVLVRLFATVPFGKLPAANRTFVSRLAQNQSITQLINDNTLVLSLLGTRGARATWNDRHQSQGHVGIPLASAAFIDKIPMMSRLLKEIGLDLDWIDRRDTDIVIKAMGRVSGVFYVQDAKTAVDQQGRKIIAAQDFVEANQVKTVFGLGGGYATSQTFVTLIVFCREALVKSQAALFTPVITNFKANTMSLASGGKIFANR
ncbi:MAG: hypothetical protein JXR84_24565 [Anaerolineae bacterium]|nr:hypothetical protein [Anaerolineae bacterium]